MQLARVQQTKEQERDALDAEMKNFEAHTEQARGMVQKRKFQLVRYELEVKLYNQNRHRLTSPPPLPPVPIEADTEEANRAIERWEELSRRRQEASLACAMAEKARLAAAKEWADRVRRACARPACFSFRELTSRPRRSACPAPRTSWPPPRASPGRTW